MSDTAIIKRRGAPPERLWKKGGPSPNPGGRPKYLERIARDFLDAQDDSRDAIPGQTRTDKLFAMLYGIAVGDGHKTADRIAAARLMFDRGHGQPRAHVDVAPAEPERFIELADLDADDLRRIADADAIVVAAAGALAPGDGEP